MRAYGEEAVGRILERVRGMVLRAKEQPEDSKQYGSLQNTTLFGVAAQVWQHLPCCCFRGVCQTRNSVHRCPCAPAACLGWWCSLCVPTSVLPCLSGLVPTTRRCTPTRRCSAAAALRPSCSVAAAA